MPLRHPDMTSRVNSNRFLTTRWAIAARRSVTGVLSAAVILATPLGAAAVRNVQAPARSNIPALAVVVAGKLLLVQGGKSSTIGPVRVKGAKPMTVTDFQWSADGGYLGWDQSNPNSGRGAIGWYDVATHRRLSWSAQVQYSEGLSVSSAGLALLAPGEDLNSPSELITYNVDGHVSHRSVTVPTSDNVVGYSGGFIMGPDIKSGTQLWRVSVSGAVRKLQALPKPASGGPLYEITAVSPDGGVFAAELGDHTDGCGVGPPSRIFVVNETKGTVSRAPLPAGPRWRVQAFVFDPKDNLDATMIDCTQRATMQTAVLWVSPRGGLLGEEKGALVATAAGIDLAYQAGRIKIGGTEAPILEEVASGPLTVNGHPLPGTNTATSASWAP